MRDYVFILLSVLQIMRFNFTDISSSQKDIHQTHTKCQISYDTYWYWCTFSIPLVFFFAVSTMCVKTILRERLLLFSINYYLLNWPLSSIIQNTEIRFIAWVKLKIACHDQRQKTFLKLFLNYSFNEWFTPRNILHRNNWRTSNKLLYSLLCIWK